MKRSELYERVWATPMTKLALELGISDVGLGKVCRRHAVPVPSRGYWAKLRAGQKPEQILLPTPELDVQIRFATDDTEERLRLQSAKRHRDESLKIAAEEAGATLKPVVFASDLDGAHPLIKATKRYCGRIPQLIAQYERRGVHAWSETKPEDRPPSESYGRYSLLHHGLLNITASMALMDWVLRFHSTIFKALTAGGMILTRQEGHAAQGGSKDAGPAVRAEYKGESFAIEFTQGYRRVYFDEAELRRKRAAQSWTSEFEHRPSENLTFRLVATEHGASKVWQGTRQKLEERVGEIVLSAFQLIPIQIELRTQRLAAQANAQREAEKRSRERSRAEARAEQLKQAFGMAKADLEVRQLQEFLERLELSAVDFQPPFDERVKAWLLVVREQLAIKDPVEQLLLECLSPSWKPWPPEWWPED